MAEEVYALMRGNTIYTLRPWRYYDPLKRESHEQAMRKYKWQGFKDGIAWRLFKTKKDFDDAVDLDYRAPEWGPHAQATHRALQDSELMGNMALDRLIDNQAALARGERPKHKGDMP